VNDRTEPNSHTQPGFIPVDLAAPESKGISGFDARTGKTFLTTYRIAEELIARGNGLRDSDKGRINDAVSIYDRAIEALGDGLG
jgi:hypothetical protein